MNIWKFPILPSFEVWLPWTPEFLSLPMDLTKTNAHFRCPTSIQTFWYSKTCAASGRGISWNKLLHSIIPTNYRANPGCSLTEHRTIDTVMIARSSISQIDLFYIPFVAWKLLLVWCDVREWQLRFRDCVDWTWTSYNIDHANSNWFCRMWNSQQ